MNFLTAAPTQAAGYSPLIMILMYGGLFAIMWFVLIRPQKKRQKAISTMQNNIKIGDSIMTSGGMYGKVVDSVNSILMVEFGTNKSVIIPVEKDQIATVKEPNLSRNNDIEE